MSRNVKYILKKTFTPTFPSVTKHEKCSELNYFWNIHINWNELLFRVISNQLSVIHWCYHWVNVFLSVLTHWTRNTETLWLTLKLHDTNCVFNVFLVRKYPLPVCLVRSEGQTVFLQTKLYSSAEVQLICPPCYWASKHWGFTAKCVD